MHANVLRGVVHAGQYFDCRNVTMVREECSVREAGRLLRGLTDHPNKSRLAESGSMT
jgi:hypothetical protein